MVAQAIGAESMEQASAAAKQVFTLLFGFSIVFGLFSFAISPYLIPALISDPEVIALGAPYLQVFSSAARKRPAGTWGAISVSPLPAWWQSDRRDIVRG